MIPFHLKFHECVFILAGIVTLLAIPFLETGGFYLWGATKVIYLIGLISIFYVRDRNI